MVTYTSSVERRNFTKIAGDRRHSGPARDIDLLPPAPLSAIWPLQPGLLCQLQADYRLLLAVYTHTLLDKCGKIGYICSACNDNDFVNYRNCLGAPDALVWRGSERWQKAGKEAFFSVSAQQVYITVLIYTKQRKVVLFAAGVV